MGFLVRIQLSDLSAEDEKELDRAVWDIGDRHPELLREMQELNRIETRRLLRQHGLSITGFPQEPYVMICPPALLEVLRRYGEKLGKALYYFHTERIIPMSGRVTVQAMTNVQFMSPKFPLREFQALNRKPLLTRAGKSLEDQFSYRYAVPAEGGAAAFLVQFRESTVMLVVAYESDADYQSRKAMNKARPIRELVVTDPTHPSSIQQ